MDQAQNDLDEIPISMEAMPELASVGNTPHSHTPSTHSPSRTVLRESRLLASDLKLQLQQAQAELAESGGKADADDRIATCPSDATALKSQLGTANAQLSKVEAYASEQTYLRAKAEAELRTAEVALVETRAELEIHTRTIVELQQQQENGVPSGVKIQLDCMRAEFSKVNANAAEEAELRAKAETKLRATETALSEAQTGLKAHADTIVELQQQLEVGTSKALKQQLAKMRTAFAMLNTNAAEEAERRVAVEAELATATAALSDAHVELDCHTKVICELQDQFGKVAVVDVSFQIRSKLEQAEAKAVALESSMAEQKATANAELQMAVVAFSDARVGFLCDRDATVV